MFGLTQLAGSARDTSLGAPVSNVGSSADGKIFSFRGPATTVLSILRNGVAEPITVTTDGSGNASYTFLIAPLTTDQVTASAAVISPAVAGKSTSARSTFISDAATSPNDRFSLGSFLAFQARNDYNQVRQQIIAVNPSTFPNNVEIAWSWPNATDNTVKSWNAIDYGNYLGTVVPTPIPSAQISTLTALNSTHSFTYTAPANSGNVTVDGFLFSSESSTQATMLCEWQAFFHTPPATKAFVDSNPSLGTYTSAAINGTPAITWNVAMQASNFFGVPYYLAYPADGADLLNATFDIKAFFDFLRGKDKAGQTGVKCLTGNEYYNGHGWGVEALRGTGSCVLSALSVTYTRQAATGIAPTLPSGKTNLITNSDFSSAYWTKQNTTGQTDGFTDVVSGSSAQHTVYAGGVTAPASTAFSAFVDVDVTNAQPWVMFQIFRQDYGAVVQAFFDIANLAYTALDGSTYTGCTADIKLLNNGKTRLYLKFNTGSGTTALNFFIKQATGAYGDTYTTTTAKKILVANPWLYAA